MTPERHGGDHEPLGATAGREGIAPPNAEVYTQHLALLHSRRVAVHEGCEDRCRYGFLDRSLAPAWRAVPFRAMQSMVCLPLLAVEWHAAVH